MFCTVFKYPLWTGCASAQCTLMCIVSGAPGCTSEPNIMLGVVRDEIEGSNKNSIHIILYIQGSNATVSLCAGTNRTDFTAVTNACNFIYVRQYSQKTHYLPEPEHA